MERLTRLWESVTGRHKEVKKAIRIAEGLLEKRPGAEEEAKEWAEGRRKEREQARAEPAAQ